MTKTVILEIRKSNYTYNCTYVVRRLQTGLDAQYYTKQNLVCNSGSDISTAPSPSKN
jgi:hypothetical protein